MRLLGPRRSTRNGRSWRDSKRQVVEILDKQKRETAKRVYLACPHGRAPLARRFRAFHSEGAVALTAAFPDEFALWAAAPEAAPPYPWFGRRQFGSRRCSSRRVAACTRSSRLRKCRCHEPYRNSCSGSN